MKSGEGTPSPTRGEPTAATWHRLLPGFMLRAGDVLRAGWVERGARIALYSLLLVVALLAFWQTHQQQSAERVRRLDVDMVDGVWNRRVAIAHLQQIILQHSRATGDAARDPDLRVQLLQARDAAEATGERLDQLLRDPQAGVWLDSNNARVLFDGWRRQRDAARWTIPGLAADASAAQPPERVGDALQAEQETLRELTVRLRSVQQVHAESRLNDIEFSTAVVATLLVFLVLLVIEPLVRYVRNQGENLVRQSTELRRLALVAERTSNWVAVVDDRRRVLWCNDAFLRGKGVPRAELLGQRSALMRPNEHNETDEIERLQAELDMGLPVRAEVLHRNRQGREVWLDVDYQPIHDGHGVLQGFTVVAVDITEGKNQRLRMRTLLDALPVGVLLQDIDGRIMQNNAAAASMLGYPADAPLRPDALWHEVSAVREDLSVYPMEDRPSIRTLKTGQGLRGESIGIIDSDGALHWLLVYTQPLRDASGYLIGVVTSMVDVTEQRDQQQLLTLAIESASLGIWHWDLPSGKMDVNDRLLTLFGYGQGELDLTSESFHELIHPDDREGWDWAIRTNLRDSQHPLHWEVRLRHGGGQWTWTLFSGTVVARNAQGRALRMAGICYDINAQKDLEEKLRQSARTDTLTHLPNRAELLTRIHASIQRARKEPGYCFAVLFMDFDRFKQVNDTLGHAVGDDLLRQIAQRLDDSLRPGDAFVQTSDFSQMAARIGGDEFVVLLDNIRGDLDAQVVAARLLDVLAEPYQIGSHTISSTASIGIVTTTHMAEDPDSVLRDADIAMYEAKRHGRGRYEMFEPAMRKRVHDDVELENDLRRALDQGEIHVVYQPMIDLARGRMVGVEALARWQHPVRGPVSPLVFIPLAEASGLISRLGEFVLRTACHELVHLQQVLGDQAPQTVSVNLSRAQLRSPGFATRVFDLLYATGLAASALVLEVTESLAAQDEGVQKVLHELRSLGVALSMDDFGTGYSSLACLHELPVNQVKIDRSFVSQALHSNYHRVMIEATIRMAQTLGLQTVAEGIETREQEELMTTLGCGKGQGYLYSRPLDPRALESWAQDRAGNSA